MLPNGISLRRVNGVGLASHGEEGKKEKTTPLQGQHPEQTINVDQSMKGLLNNYCGSNIDTDRGNIMTNRP